jgi:hypothetical protein
MIVYDIIFDDIDGFCKGFWWILSVCIVKLIREVFAGHVWFNNFIDLIDESCLALWFVGLWVDLADRNIMNVG